MKQVDLEPKAYRNHAPIPVVGWWFFGSLAVCIAAMVAFWATSYDNLAMLAMFLGALNLGKSYARWADPSGAVFAPGGIRKLGAFGIVVVLGIAAALLTYPVYLFSCNFITKTCINSEPMP